MNPFPLRARWLMWMAVIVEACCWILAGTGAYLLDVQRNVFGLFILGIGLLTMWKIAPQLYHDAEAQRLRESKAI
jgi:hypothetical protein